MDEASHVRSAMAQAQDPVTWLRDEQAPWPLMSSR
jgi:hypothetical protein